MSRRGCGCCGCKDLQIAFYFDKYLPVDAKCFVEEIITTTTTTDFGLPSQSTSVSTETVESVDGVLAAGRWKWRKTTFETLDGTTTRVTTEIVETRRLAVVFDVSDQYLFGGTTENGSDVLTDAGVAATLSVRTRDSYANASSQVLGLRLYSLLHDAPMPSNGADLSDLINEATDMTVWQIGTNAATMLDRLPTTATGTVMVIFAEHEDEVFGVQQGALLSNIAFAMTSRVSPPAFAGALLAEANWRTTFDRIAEWTYVSKRALVNPGSVINIPSLGLTASGNGLNPINASAITIEPANLAVEVSMFDDLTNEPLFSFYWNWATEVGNAGIIPPGIPPIQVEADAIIAGHVPNEGPPTVTVVDPPVSRYFIRFDFSENHLQPLYFSLQCDDA